MPLTLASVSQLSTESMLTTAPPPLAASTGAKACTTRSGPMALVWIWRSSASGAFGASSGPGSKMPALFTTRFTSRRSRASAAICSGWVTSNWTGTTPACWTVAGLRAAA